MSGTRGPLTRCIVHILRKSEDFAMANGVGSAEHTRHTMLQGLYHDAKEAGMEVERRAGGPVRCASQLGIDTQGARPGRVRTQSSKARLTDRLDMITDVVPARRPHHHPMQNARDDSYNALEVPGMPFHNNGVEGTIRDCVVPDRRRCRFLNERAAYNHSMIRSFAATCRKNGISPYRATVMMAEDARWSIFNSGIPPPIFCRGAPGCGKPPSARPGTP